MEMIEYNSNFPTLLENYCLIIRNLKLEAWEKHFQMYF